MENKKIVEMAFGSHLYGLDTPTSDKDFKGVILPTAKQILMQEAKFSLKESTGNPHEKNTVEDTDIEFISLQRFIDFACQGETFAIDMLHAPREKIIQSSTLWDIIVENRDKFYTKNMKAYVGYVRKQAAKYGVKGSRLAVLEEVIHIVKDLPDEIKNPAKDFNNYIPTRLLHVFSKLPKTEFSGIVVDKLHNGTENVFYEILGRKFQDKIKLNYFKEAIQKIYDEYGERAQQAKKNEGIDWKAISHALRAGYQAKYIYLEGGFEYPLKETAFLRAVKAGELDYINVVQPELELLVEEVMELADKSNYPEKVNRKFWNNLIEDVHHEIIIMAD